ncbi:hypothetical protein ACIBH1_19940 [Nonomuraea sp. NPDC050663]|uniref:hypothetical protein n=1 Tax=Nonomuraea sp. NPDC050663 TaxID=3364370 RepID=UPI0037A78E48
MPTPQHDALRQLFLDRPELAIEVLRDLLAVELPETPLIRVESPTFNTRNSDDIETDGTLVLGPPHEPSLGIAIEVQRDRNKDPVQFARYAASMWLMLRCDAIVLLICPDEKTATHYSRAIRTGLTGFDYRCHVVGPAQVGPVTSPRFVVEQPEQASISLAMHWKVPGVVETFASGVAQLPPRRGYEAFERACAIAGPEGKILLEEYMKSTEVPIVSSFGQEYYGRGKAEGQAEGRAKGKAEGKAEEAAKMLALVLEARGLPVTPQVAARITACTDPERLEGWTRLAATADSLDDVFPTESDA